MSVLTSQTSLHAEKFLVVHSERFPVVRWAWLSILVNIINTSILSSPSFPLLPLPPPPLPPFSVLLMLIKIICDYCQIVDDLPNLVTDILSKLADMLKVMSHDMPHPLVTCHAH